MSMIIGQSEKDGSPQDNVVNLSTPRMVHDGYRSVSVKRLRHSINKKDICFSTNLERLQIKSIEDETGLTLSRARKAIEDIPVETRCFNPSPSGWMDPASNKSNIGRVHQWWLDIVHVLSQTVPSLAKTYFISLDELFDGDTKVINRQRRLLEKRLKKLNPKKVKGVRSLLNGSKELTQEEYHRCNNLVQTQVDQVFWKEIAKNLGRQYATNFVMNPFTIDRLMVEQFQSEMMIRGIADFILGEESTSSHTVESDRFGQVGDAATVIASITSHIALDELNYHGLIHSKHMQNYFDADVLGHIEKAVELITEIH